MDSNACEMPAFGDLINLSVEKLEELGTILASILALPLARDTFAQIIDGSPIRTPYSDDFKARRSPLTKTIIVSDKTKPSENAIHEYERIRTDFTIHILRVDLKLAQKYQNAPPGSLEHRLSLLEIAAASVNAFAGILFRSFHSDTNIRPPEPPQGHFYQFRMTDHFYVDFYHTNYRLFDRYPFGLLSVVGYWAEAEIFGGVVLFERGESGSGSINAFLHPQKASHAFQLSDGQLEKFAKPAGTETVLPFAKEPGTRTEPTFPQMGGPPVRIYKNEYDRQVMSYAPKRPSCVITEDDPRAASMRETMRIVEENGWNRTPPISPAPTQPEPSLQDTPSLIVTFWINPCLVSDITISYTGLG